MELTETQKNTVIVLTVVLGSIIILISLLTTYWFLQSVPPAPSLTPTNGRSLESIQVEIENYKILVPIIKENKSYLYDMLVAKFIKPLFDSLLVSIVAYLFGKPIIAAISTGFKGNNQ